MKYTGEKCPVCKETFNNNDDVVVCPDCGTPYHRECYRKNGECIFKDKHGEDFKPSDEESQADGNIENDNLKKCPRCSHENREEALFCDKCGLPLTQGFTGAPYTGAVQTMFDPMGGVDPSEQFGDDITAGDIAKYVQAGTPYYMNVFKRIKENGRSKFNFAALLFSGGWLLYRKQYKAGIVVTAVVAVLMILSIFLSLTYTNDVLNTVLTNAQVPENVTYSQMAEYMDEITKSYNMLSVTDRLLLVLPVTLDSIRFAISFIFGFIGNKLYYKHCLRSVSRIKKSDDAKPLSERLRQSGGVNTALAFVLIICYFIINYLPYYFL